MDILALLGRKKHLFENDIEANANQLSQLVSGSTFLVIGGGGSIGQAVVKEIFKRNPLKLHVVDINENNLTELVRDVRSTFGYIDGDFRTFALDIGSTIYDAFIANDGKYDYVLNLSALKHVRSEKDPYTLMRMIDVNIFNTDKTLLQSIQKGTKKYFCVSTDKAANPVNMMGASKSIMEQFLMRRSKEISISTARFANVAFSDGSLLHSFNQRIQKNQPIVAPTDVRRYFLTPQESGELCLMSCLFGENRDIYFPKLSEDNDLLTFTDIAINYLKDLGFEPYLCQSEEEARSSVESLKSVGKWPCYFSPSDTTGEKEYEEFFTTKEVLDLAKHESFGIIKNEEFVENEKLDYFSSMIESMKEKGSWEKQELVKLFREMLPDLEYEDKGKYLDSKM
jgi:FlaA1/EpsC-like NDP-sugar epimerase